MIIILRFLLDFLYELNYEFISILNIYAGFDDTNNNIIII